MPEYDFIGLSPQDFELLTRDILNAQYDLRLASHPAGPDQGIDLRGESSDGRIVVVQCKHYAKSQWSTLQRAVSKEVARKQQPRFDRYVFVTSQPLTAPRRDWIIAEFTKAGFELNLDDVWGPDDLNEALGRYSEVERRHFKLWLASTGVLETILNAGQWQRREDLLDRARDRARVWVAVPEFDRAWHLLEQPGVCVLTGPPGAGKSSLAEMLLLEHVREGWNVVPVTDIEAGWPVFRDESKQVVYYDDFLGTTELSLTAKGESAQLVQFIERVRSRSGHKRLILTTREQILNRAMNTDDRLSGLTGVVRLDGYSAEIKAHMLRNHLYFSRLNATEQARIALDNRLPTAVEHPSYNPRLVERVTAEITEQSTADDVTERLLAVLDNPQLLWHATFTSMDRLCREILLTLATLPAVPCPVDELRALVRVPDAVLWTPALRELEPTWLRLLGRGPEATVVLANPGCRDYLLTVLDDTAVATERLANVRRIDQYVVLTQASGLTHGDAGRPYLAHVLKQRAGEITSGVRDLAPSELAAASTAEQQLAIVADAVLLAGIHGSDRTTGWVFELVARYGTSESSTLGYLRLAERLSGVPTDNPAERTRLVHLLVTTGLAKARAIQDLDAYEAFPSRLLPDGARDQMRERARVVIQAELDYLAYHSEDPETLTADARSLRQRAQSYGFDADIAALLDRAEDLAHGDYSSEV